MFYSKLFLKRNCRVQGKCNERFLGIKRIFKKGGKCETSKFKNVWFFKVLMLYWFYTGKSKKSWLKDNFRIILFQMHMKKTRKKSFEKEPFASIKGADFALWLKSCRILTFLHRKTLDLKFFNWSNHRAWNFNLWLMNLLINKKSRNLWWKMSSQWGERSQETTKGICYNKKRSKGMTCQS